MYYLYTIQDNDGERLDWGVVDAATPGTAKQQLLRHFSDWLREPCVMATGETGAYGVHLVPIRRFDARGISVPAADLYFALNPEDDA